MYLLQQFFIYWLLNFKIVYINKKSKHAFYF
jgi:hypothetical protein